MTNLLSQISIILSLVTNWTGVTVGTNELGYVATNHTAELTYQGVKREFHLLSEPSSIAVWRPWVPKYSGGITNLLWQPWCWTNIDVLGTIEGG